MSREKWEPTDAARAEHEARHTTAEAYRKAAHVKQYLDCVCSMCIRYRAERDELLS